eukprot:gene31530-38940_t
MIPFSERDAHILSAQQGVELTDKLLNLIQEKQDIVSSQAVVIHNQQVKLQEQEKNFQAEKKELQNKVTELTRQAKFLKAGVTIAAKRAKNASAITITPQKDKKRVARNTPTKAQKLEKMAVDLNKVVLLPQTAIHAARITSSPRDPQEAVSPKYPKTVWPVKSPKNDNANKNKENVTPHKVINTLSCDMRQKAKIGVTSPVWKVSSVDTTATPSLGGARKGRV